MGDLNGRRIVVPETRELGQLVRMLEERGADTVSCPMIAIRDAPDPAPVEAWLRRFAGGACDDLVLMTGEGLRRLLGFARRLDLESAFLNALAVARKFTRGPKPVRALREVGLAADVPADEPTTEGVIAALERHDLTARRVGVQLYPDNPNERLLKFLKNAGAEPDPVLPYVYVSEANDARVIAVIAEIAFTSAPQVRRFRDVARAAGRDPQTDLLVSARMFSRQEFRSCESLSHKTIRPHNAHAEYLSFSAMVIPFESVRAAVPSDLLRRMSGAHGCQLVRW
jgi:uroporphyrinogen-III synthase